jgi:hypothetical protein
LAALGSNNIIQLKYIIEIFFAESLN